MKNWMKKFLIIVLLVCSLSLFGCNQVVSAYDIAVKNGFVGTEKEWLESLKGNNGAPGEDGTFDVEILFQKAVEMGLYSDNSKESYQKFLQDYFTKNNSLDAGKKCINQVVSIYCENSVGVFVGAGVFYKIDRTEKYAYIITNYHVVALPDSENETSSTNYAISPSIKCYIYGNETFYASSDALDDETYNYGSGAFNATYIGGSADFDIAVLKVSGSDFDIIDNSSAMEVSFADSNKVQAGDIAIAIGNPMGGGISLTSGVVSVVSEYVNISIAGAKRVLRCLRMDTSINGGNSGGGLFNSDGQLIGICNAKLFAAYYENVANAIVATNVKNVCENIVYNYEKSGSTGSVGVNKLDFGFVQKGGDMSNQYDQVTNTNKLVSTGIVTDVYNDSIAKTMGLAVNDAILGIKITRNDTSLTTYFQNYYDIFDISLTIRDGDKISLIVSRPQEESSSTIELTQVTVQESNFTVFKDNG